VPKDSKELKGRRVVKGIKVPWEDKELLDPKELKVEQDSKELKEP
jgi:hypothetical protein